MFEKIKQLTKDTAIYGVSTIVGRFLTFLLVPFYTNIFLPNEYGIVANLYIFIAILNIIYIFGMDAAFLKFASTKQASDKKDNFSTPYLTVLIFSVLLSLLIILFKATISSAFEVPENYFYLIYYTSAILLIDALCVIPFIKLRIERKAKKFAAIKIINILTNVLLNLILILYFKWGIEAVFVSNILASLLTFFILIPDILKNLKLNINRSLLNKLIRFGLPYLPAGLASMFIQGIDRPILTNLTDLNTVGIYNANYKLGIFMMLFVNMFQYAWQPFFLQEAETREAKKVFSKVLTYFTYSASMILVIVSLFIEDIVKIDFFGITLIGSAYWSGLVIVPIILLGYLFNGLYVVFTAGIYIEDKSIYVPLITGIGAAVNIIVNLLLIPALGIVGAALATLASYIVMALGLYLVTQKFYKIDYEKSKMLGLFSLISVCAIAYYWLQTIDASSILIKSLLLIFFIIISTIIVFNKKELIALRNKLIKN